MVQPAARIAHHHDPLGAQVPRGIEGELEVGCIFLGRMTLDASAGRLDGGETAARDGVEVSDGDGDFEPQLERRVHPAVGRDDAGPLRQVCPGRYVG